MNTAVERQLHRLVILLANVDEGAFTIALFDRLSMRREIVAELHKQLKRPVFELTLSEQERNPIDMIRALKPNKGDVVNLFDIERAFPEVLGYLNLQREVIADMGISPVVWTTNYEYRELAKRAPDFYAFRSSVFDFTTVGDIQPSKSFFVGREAELSKLTSSLTQGGITVVAGLGGIGKTALSREAARTLHAHFSGGIVWINCETKPSLGDIIVTSAVATIGDFARGYLPDEQRQRLDDTLRDHPCLIVLDNFETISEDGETLRWLKTIKAPSSVLITSRESVPYLRATTLKLDVLSRNEAVGLFSRLACDAGWDADNPLSVLELCQLVGDLPLAIELIAPLASELSITALTYIVRERLSVIADPKGTGRDERHQSIEACFQVSFDRLSEAARSLLTRLSILPDGASEQIVGPYTGISHWRVPIAECVRRSMLSFDGQGYWFHPLVRSFALEQLGEARSEWEKRYGEFYDASMSKYALLDITSSSTTSPLAPSTR